MARNKASDRRQRVKWGVVNRQQRCQGTIHHGFAESQRQKRLEARLAGLDTSGLDLHRTSGSKSSRAERPHMPCAEFPAWRCQCPLAMVRARCVTAQRKTIKRRTRRRKEGERERKREEEERKKERKKERKRYMERQKGRKKQRKKGRKRINKRKHKQIDEINK